MSNITDLWNFACRLCMLRLPFLRTDLPAFRLSLFFKKNKKVDIFSLPLSVRKLKEGSCAVLHWLCLVKVDTSDRLMDIQTFAVACGPDNCIYCAPASHLTQSCPPHSVPDTPPHIPVYYYYCYTS